MQRRTLLACILGLLALGIFFASKGYGNYGGFSDLLGRIIPRPLEPHEQQPSVKNFTISVWFNVGVTESEAKDLIESVGVGRLEYELSDPKTWNDPEHGGMAIVDVPTGLEEQYLHSFKSSDIVLDAQLNIIYESNEGN